MDKDDYDDDCDHNHDHPRSILKREGYGSANDELTIHLWVDTPPSSVKDTYRIDDLEDDSDHKFKSPKSGKKASKRAYDPKHSSKKVHPRSHEHNISSPEGSKRKNSIDSCGGEGENDLLLDKNHFFHGFCKSSTKSSSKKASSSLSSTSTKHKSLFYKYNKKLKQRSLFDILVYEESAVDLQEASKKVLEESLNAATSTYFQSHGISEDDKSHDNAMQMVYYLEVDLRKQLQMLRKLNGEKKSEVQVSELVSSALSSEQCPIGSCVYACYKRNLLFDRYRGGIVIGDNERQTLVNNGDRKQQYCDDAPSNEKDPSIHTDLNQLPVAILEHILAFAEDEASGVFSMVCKDWYREIGKTSPALWLNLLQRRDWPKSDLMEEADEHYDGEMMNSFEIVEESRSIFIRHKNITRAIDVMLDGIEYLQSNSSDLPVRNTLVLHESKDSKTRGFVCSGLHHWDDTTMIFANGKECLLTLFKAERNDDVNTTLSCKQILSTRVAPIPHSKKTSCELTSFALDDQNILCMYEVGGSCDWLVLLKREELLLNSAETVLDKNSFHVFELVELFEKSYYDYGELDGLRDLFENDILPDHLEIFVDGDILSCGDGHYFIFLINICTHSTVEDDDEPLRFIARAVVQFSVKKQCLTWGTCIPAKMAPATTKTILSNYDSTSRTIVCSSSPQHPVMVLLCEKGGSVLNYFHDEYCRFPRGVWDDPDRTERHKRMNVVSSTNAIFADHLTQEEERKMMLLSFLNLQGEESDNLYSHLTLREIDQIFSLHVQGAYCIVIGGKEPNLNDEDEDIFDGHWFGDDNERNRAGCHIIIIHIPSRTEIYRRSSESSCFNGLSLSLDENMCPSVLGVTRDRNIVMSSQRLRDIKVSSSEKTTKSSKAAKPKKKKKAIKNNKKDGFARGMSLRG